MNSFLHQINKVTDQFLLTLDDEAAMLHAYLCCVVLIGC
jgi:hypothetical protein